MNEIILRGRPVRRLLFVGAVALVLAVSLPPAFGFVDCGYANRIKCEVYNAARPYFGVFFALIMLVPYRRFLLGKPVITLTRDGIEGGVYPYPMDMIPWAHIESVETRRMWFVETLAVGRRADTVPTPRSLLDKILSALFAQNARTHLHVAQLYIDRSLQHLKHWIDEGRRNAAAGKSPEPFFTAPY